MTSNTTQLLLIAIFFAITGLCTLLFRRKKKFVGLIPLTIGTVAIFLTTIGPLSESQNQIDKILQLDRSEIAKVSIKPSEDRSYEKISLTHHFVEIMDKTIIDSLCLTLTKAKVTNSTIKNPKWVCIVRFHKADQSFLEFEVKNAGQDTFVEVKSNGNYGWNYGTLDAKYFGQMLVNVAK